MTIREIITAFTDKKHDPSILDLELFVVTSTETFDASKYPQNPVPDNPKIQAGMFDGGKLLKCRPIESIAIAGPNGLAIFIDPRKESEKKSVFLVNPEKFPGVAICGKIPTDLKWPNENDR